MIALLTWPAFGSWLPGPARGRVEREPHRGPPPAPFRPVEPDAVLSASRRSSLKWPAVRLDRRQGEVIVADLARIASIRDFAPRLVVVAADHVHLLLEVGEERDVDRLVHDVKGALSRALTVDAGDRAALDADGAPLPHHKWWARQHALQVLCGDAEVAAAERALREHEGEGAMVCEMGSR